MDLATMRGLVQRDPVDTGLAVWAADDIDRAIRRALREYSQTLPYWADRTVTVATAGPTLPAGGAAESGSARPCPGMSGDVGF